MNNEQLIEQWFQDSAKTLIQCGEALKEDLLLASQQVVNALVNDRKIITCGSGSSSHVSQFFSTTLLNQCQRERPGLPAISLDSHASTILGIGQDYGAAEVYARQIHALGQSGDLFVLFSCTETPQALNNAILAAHDREMAVIAFTGGTDNNIASLLYPGDREILALSNSRLHVHQLHLLIALSLIELVENALFGAADD